MYRQLISHNFWSGRKVLITGHTGFKGGWLSYWLSTLGADLVGVSIPTSSSPSLISTYCLPNNMRTYNCDIRNFEDFNLIVNQERPEIVFHLAAQPIVSQSYDDPLHTISTNVMGTSVVFEAIRQSKTTKTIINVTSDKVYYNDESGRAFQEEDKLSGKDPYSGSKSCADIIASSFSHSFLIEQGISVYNARAGNVIGGGDIAVNRLIPDLFRSYSAKKQLVIRNPGAVRPWQHVLEPIAGYIALAQRGYNNPTPEFDSFNFGPSPKDHWSVKQIVEYFSDRLKIDIDFQENKNNIIKESNLLNLNINKAQSQLGWKPVFELATALDLTWIWYEEALNYTSASAVTDRQINLYTELLC
ncbi:CDP-glucose 4,6-dehydratase [Roseobacter sp. HKCC-CH-9208]|uniref:CDP-glucose 4,6-dehydratase n=1 Tax=Roseobacter sp. HKCC-CH-9208 TaxID=3120339 RepID=UPI0030EC214C